MDTYLVFQIICSITLYTFIRWEYFLVASLSSFQSNFMILHTFLSFIHFLHVSASFERMQRAIWPTMLNDNSLHLLGFSMKIKCYEIKGKLWIQWKVNVCSAFFISYSCRIRSMKSNVFLLPELGTTLPRELPKFTAS